MGVYLYPNNTETPLKDAYIGIPNPTSIVLDKRFINLNTVGQTEQLTATIEPTISDHSITWSSDDTTVATVSTTGLVTCVTPGECTITATTVNGLTAICSVAQGLPSAYQEVEYIQSSGTQYIDTGHQHTANSKVELKLSFQSMSTQWNCIFGSRQNNISSNAFGFGAQYSSKIWASVGGYDNVAIANISVDTIYEISLSKDNFTINGTSTALTTNLTSYSYNDLLFSMNENGNPTPYNMVKAKMYYCKIYESNTLVRNLVPCYRKADNEIGMYDVVNDVFYTNSGTGTFTKGPDV